MNDPICFSTSMTSAEWASWVQAIAVAVAIFASVLIANWQTNKQVRQAQELQHKDFKERQKRIVGAVAAMGTGSLNILVNMSQSVGTRDQVHALGRNDTFLDFSEIDALSNSLESIPLVDLTNRKLVSDTLIVRSVLRQFRDIVKSAIFQSRQMNGAQFTDFFNTIQAMDQTISEAVLRIEQEYSELD